MRFSSFTTPEGEAVGVATPDGYFGEMVRSLGTDLMGLIARGDDALLTAGKRLAGGVRLNPKTSRFLPVIPRPQKIICIGLNYHDHAAESGFTPPSYPTVFARYATSLVGHGAPIVRPNVSDQLDYEGELAIIIGLGGRHISKAQALKHVAGYALFNDGSIRDYQFKSPQWTVGKTFDGTGAFGPEMVTRDEVPPGCRGLKLETRLNGEIVQSASTDSLIFSVADLISILSEAITLTPGDVIVSGTPAGVGAARKPQLWMKPGDTCEVSLEGFATLSNPITQEERPR